MRAFCRALGCAIVVLLVATISYGSTISGSVKGPEGTPFRGAFIQAQNTKSKITVSVLSDKDGHFQVEGLAAGDYNVLVKAIGFKGNTHPMTLTADQLASQDFALTKGMVRW